MIDHGDPDRRIPDITDTIGRSRRFGNAVLCRGDRRAGPPRTKCDGHGGPGGFGPASGDNTFKAIASLLRPATRGELPAN